ncbi:MAG: hypothetical protein ACE5HT_15270 [Gemmatimonadales bacterium]
MGVSEERLQLLLSRRLKAEAKRRAEGLGVSVGHYVRQLIEDDVRGVREPARGGGPAMSFPFGDRPIATGRRRGSVEHDRPR